MYEELIANLREHAEWDKAGIWVIPVTIIYDLRKAADAIEELSAKYQKALSDLVKQAETPKEET